MCDDDINPWLPADPAVSRRTFGLSIAAAVSLTAAQARAQAKVTEKDVTVKTADGEAEAVLLYPSGKGTWPAVLVWTDIMGLRPVFREMGRRLASQGYVVLVPNPFYRSAKSSDYANLNFGVPEGRQKLMSYRGAMNDAGVDNDAQAYLAFLDAQPQTNKKKMVGVQGYCMGGPLSFRTAGAVPARIGAVATFHGGGLVTDKPDSPHLLVPKMKAQYLFAVAENDDKAQPDAKVALRDAFDRAKLKAEIEVYAGALHGWCPPDAVVYNQAQAERAWERLLATFKAGLA